MGRIYIPYVCILVTLAIFTCHDRAWFCFLFVYLYSNHTYYFMTTTRGGKKIHPLSSFIILLDELVMKDTWARIHHSVSVLAKNQAR